MFKHTKRRTIGKILLIVVLLLLISGAGGVFALRQWYVTALKPLSSSEETVLITVNQGSTPKTIGQLLVEKGIIRNARAFETYVRGSGDADKLKAGTFELRSNMSTQEVVSVLIEGKEISTLFTIPPGLRLDQIKTRFISAGYTSTEVDAAFSVDKYRDIPLLSSLPATTTSLEGYIYPETFQITQKDTPETIVRRSITELDAIVTKEIREGIAAQGVSVHDAITLASIIEKEVAGLADRKQVAQVFYLRLSEGISLGADATYLYDAAVNGGLPFPENTSAYNTRKVQGLPPGPISNFSKSAIEAVAFPADTDYLFYVTGDDGTNYFTRTEAEHVRATKAYCTVTCAPGYIPPDLR
jgi:UPF0755 protein